MYNDASITDFPLGTNGSEVYDIVYLGNVIPNYINSSIPKILSEKYVFLFVTLLKGKKESCYYGQVRIYLVKHELLSYFNYQIRERGNMHVLDKENLKINDFLEIVQEETEQGKQIIAQLKNQNIIRNLNKIAYKRDFGVLLVKENSKDCIDNIPVLELGPEFSLQLEYDRVDERVKELKNTKIVLSGIINRNNIDLESSKSTKSILDILKKEIEETKQKRDELFDELLTMNRNLSYVYKVAD